MKRNALLSKTLCAVCSMALVFSLVPDTAKADNPFVQTFYTSDPAPIVNSDNVLYAITDHDEDITEHQYGQTYDFFTMKEWRSYSTTDMVNWTDHGAVFKLSDISWADQDDRRAWAPQAVEKDGKFYLYFPCVIAPEHRKNGSYYGVGVAVADSLNGPFVDAIGEPLYAGGSGDIDPTVFVDDDGQAYIYFGQSLKFAKLSDDMISFDGEVKAADTSGLKGYVEGPWFYGRTNPDTGVKNYYFVYAGSGTNHEDMIYSMADSPEGPWNYGGMILENRNFPCVDDGKADHGTGTIHGGAVDYKGHSYLFYHNGGLPGGFSYHRSACIEEFTYNEDGTIPLMEMSYTDVQAIEYLNPYNKTEAETICWEYGVKTVEEVKDDGTQGVTVYNMHNNDYIKLESVDFGSVGADTFTATVKDVKADSDASIEIYVKEANSVEGMNPQDIFQVLISSDKVGTVKLDNDSDTYKDITVKLDKKVTGVHDVFFVFKGAYEKPEAELDPSSVISEDDTGMFKFDSWQFKEEVIATPTPAPQQPTVTPAPAPTPEAVVDTISSSKVKVKAANVKGKKIKVTLKKVADAKGYNVVVSNSKKFKSKMTINSKKTTVTIKKFKKAKLKKGKTYYIKARAYGNDSTGKKVYGKYSKAVKVKIKK